QKGILIGERGATMKKIGTAARKELEQILGTKIFMELFVKVMTNWRQNATMVKQLDWHRQLEDLQKRQSPGEEADADEPDGPEDETATDELDKSTEKED
ncbi:MAG: KH domain-containing protein, partial [Candidatus Acidiferrales bacterium]